MRRAYPVSRASVPAPCSFPVPAGEGRAPVFSASPTLRAVGNHVEVQRTENVRLNLFCAPGSEDVSRLGVEVNMKRTATQKSGSFSFAAFVLRSLLYRCHANATPGRLGAVAHHLMFFRPSVLDDKGFARVFGGFFVEEARQGFSRGCRASGVLWAILKPAYGQIDIPVLRAGVRCGGGGCVT